MSGKIALNNKNLFLVNLDSKRKNHSGFTRCQTH